MAQVYGQTLELVRDINTSPTATSKPSSLIVMNNKLYFTADDGIHGRELWVTDGTFDGTHIVADIRPSGDGNPIYLTEYRSKLYFQANEWWPIGAELWSSDGTELGTTRVKNINPNGDAAPTHLRVLQDKLFFRATDGIHNGPFWVTDGTSDNTVLATDIPVGKDYGFLGFIEFQDKAYFQFTRGPYKGTLWKTDGTISGTIAIIDTPSTNPRFNLTYLDKLESGSIVYNDLLYFGNGELWVTDGTTSGTHQFKDLWANGYSDPINFTLFNGKIFFGAYSGKDSAALWITDGTEAGTLRIKEFYEHRPSRFTPYQGKLYFTAADAVHGVELWSTDGTEDGTRMVRDLKAPINGSEGNATPGHLTILNNVLYFMATSDTLPGHQLWQIDDTVMTPIPLSFIPYYRALIPPLGVSLEITTYNGCLYFTANYDSTSGFELWKYCPTESNVGKIKEISIHTISPNPVYTTFEVHNSESLHLRITDLLGRVVYHSQIEPHQKIDVRSLPTGTYFVSSRQIYIGSFTKK